MTDVRKLLDEATPLPWVVQQPGDNDPGAGTVFIDTHAYEDGPEPVIAESYPLHRADADLIVHAVNHLPDYEAAVDAGERVEQEFQKFWDDDEGGSMDPLVEAMLEFRAVLRRLRGEG